MQPADHVRADHEIALGVDRLAGPIIVSHQPALPVTGCMEAHVLIAGQRVTHQYRIAARGVERAVSLVRDLKWRDGNAGVELQRLVGAKAHDKRLPRIVRVTGQAFASRVLLCASP
jgi:hypothetical protein